MSLPSSSQQIGRGTPDSTDPVRVLHVVEHWRPCTTGYATRSWELITAQSETDGLHPTVLVSSRQSIRENNSVEVPDGLDGQLDRVPPSTLEQWLRPVRANTLDGGHHQAAIEQIARECGADIIHVHWSSGLGLAAARAAENVGCQLVAEVRFDLAGAVMTETVRMPVSLLEQSLRWYFERHLPRADAVVAASHSLADLIQDTFAALERPIVVPNAVDHSLFTPSPPEPPLRNELGLQDAFVVGTTSNMLRYEGLDQLLAATRSLRDQGIDARTLFVGDGPWRNDLERAADRHDVPAVFTGRVPFQEVPRHLRVMNAFAVPRRDVTATRFASPIKVVEAMACGCPVVASRVGDLPELLNEDRGLLIPPDDVASLSDALHTLAAEPERRATLGNRACTFVKRERSWANAARRCAQIYEAAMNPAQ